MDIEIIEEKENPLLERKEIIVKIGHGGSSTPKSVEIRKLLLAKLGAGDDQLILGSLKQKYGTTEATATVNIYKSMERAQQVENPYVIKKNFTQVTPEEPAPSEEGAEKVDEQQAPPEKMDKAPTATEEKPVEAVEPPKKVEEKKEAPAKKEKTVEEPAKEKPVSVEEKKAPVKVEAPKTAEEKPEEELKPAKEPSKGKKEKAPKDKKPSEKKAPGKKPAKKPVKKTKEG